MSHPERNHAEHEAAYDNAVTALSHMTADDYFVEANILLAKAISETDPSTAAQHIALAQVYATLAMYRP